MAFNIQEFKANLTNIARPTLFTVHLNSVPAVQTWPQNLMEFTCKGSQLPSFTTGKIQVPYLGRKVNFPGDIDYQDWQVTVIGDRRYNIWRALYAWRQAWNANVSNITDTTQSVHTRYKADAEMRTYDNAGNVVLNVYLVGLHPIDVPAVEMSWETNDSTLDIQCTFMMDYFYVKETNGSQQTVTPSNNLVEANAGVPASTSTSPYYDHSGTRPASNDFTG